MMTDIKEKEIIMKKSALTIGMLILLSTVLAGGVVFAQEKRKRLSETCSFEQQKSKDGKVIHVLKGKGCKAIAEKINQTAAEKTKAYGCKCTCILETGSNIWICRCCKKSQLDW